MRLILRCRLQGPEPKEAYSSGYRQNAGKPPGIVGCSCRVLLCLVDIHQQRRIVGRGAMAGPEVACG